MVEKLRGDTEWPFVSRQGGFSKVKEKLLRAEYHLFTATLHGLLRDAVDLLLHGHLAFLPALRFSLNLHQQHTERRAAEVQCQEVPVL